jgi:hypothetical protein
MKNFKQHDIAIIAIKSNNKLNSDKEYLTIIDEELYNPFKNEYYELHITSNDKIEEGDWFYDIRESYSKIIYQCIRISSNFIFNANKEINHLIEFCKKIIATTDSSLVNKKEQSGENVWVQQIPTSFIEIFISEYNKGNIITKVMVEYETKCKELNALCTAFNDDCPACDNKLLINPDNTININLIKDSWNSLEITELLRKFENSYNTKFCKSATIYCKPCDNDRVAFIDEFIEQKL